MMTAKQIIITCMLFHNNIQNIRLAIRVFFRFTDVVFRFTDVVSTLTERHYQVKINGECCNKNCLKGRGGNDVQQKKRKETLHLCSFLLKSFYFRRLQKR